MGWVQDREELQAYIGRLEALAGEADGLSAEARVTALAAIVNAKAALHATEVVTSYTGIIRGDVTGPLVDALGRFAEQAEALTGALGRLPDR